MIAFSVPFGKVSPRSVPWFFVMSAEISLVAIQARAAVASSFSDILGFQQFQVMYLDN